MLRSLEINAVLSGLEKVYRDRLFWKPRIQTSQEDRLRLRTVVDFWRAPFKDAKRGTDATPLSNWVRLHYGSHCPHQETTSEGSIQTNVRRPTGVYCGGCKTEIAVDAEVPSIRLLV